MGVAERVTELVEPVLAGRDLELVDVEHTGPVVRVIVDREGGIDLDTLSEVTREVSRALDDHDPMPGRYTLEVSSPGLERPLKRPEHFRRVVGSQVSARLAGHAAEEAEGGRRIDGTLEEADDQGVVIAGQRLAYTDIEKARTVFEWGPSPKPGAGRRGPKQDSRDTKGSARS